MTSTPETAAPVRAGLRERFAAFVAERRPFALKPALAAFEQSGGDAEALRDALRIAATDALRVAVDIPETQPRIAAADRLQFAVDQLLDDCDGFLRREAITASLTADEKREILRGMLLTRATDNRLKQFFTAGEVRYGSASFQGKGFRSLGQEAIYAAPLRLRRGPDFRDGDHWRGDVVSPMIRDLGAVLAMHNDATTVRLVLNAQMGKAGAPMNGKDLHVGDWTWGVFPAMAPLGSPALTMAGIAMAFAMDARESNASPNIAVSFIGEGATSLGEWHEAINACAARRLPAIFCVQNNQTALSTPKGENSAVRTFADKALGYGMPAITIDGTDPDAIASAFAWGAERAREGRGPVLIELIAMRMCGHAHHDDMLYLGKDPQTSWSYPPLTESGYADRESYDYWCGRDPIATYAARLEADGIVAAGEVDAWKREIEELVEQQARIVIDAPWPEGAAAGDGVIANEPRRAHVEVLDEEWRQNASRNTTLPEVEDAPPFDAKGKTFLEAVMLGVGDALRADPRAFVYGEDVGGKYGNAFLLLKPLLKEFGDRIINSILAEGAVLGVATGAALMGRRPIAEIQFNDFIATGFNQLVNNAAKIRYRWGGEVPLVVRMPWGGLRHAGPYHSQNTEAWFYRTPGLKIVVPSTPHDARALMASCVNDPDPVLYYEHIALYRDPKVKQLTTDTPPPPIPLGKAALRRAGDHLAIISYGAYVHVAMRVAEKLAKDGIECAVLDLRSLAPLDREAILACARHCNRVLIVHEDTRTGSIGESVAAIIQEEAFEYLDAPIRILGALDTPVPYSPPLEDVFLVSEEQVERAARLLVGY
ncbi:MAG: 2-oxoisovalerate dehydrogenase component [Acidobacteriota bacterium]|jgi:2-oxoisovalerate dehydrogenase E1 component|nr:2-oxoisovalerate dehydrogenase component [Acidobacteriota bacterium]